MKRKSIGRHLAIVMACLFAMAVLFVGVGDASATTGHDHNHFTHGEDEGYYDENNNNPYDDDTFPGDSVRKRAGTQW